MRVPCFLRELREGLPMTLREMETETGIHRGQLSRYEQGRELVLDKHQIQIEEAYQAPAEDWYPKAVLLLIERDHERRDAA
jgi:transcriptional regulator with XRE-family HTH domain